MSILTHISHLLTLSRLPPIAHHALAGWQWSMSERGQIDMLPGFLPSPREFMKVAILVHEHHLLATTSRPTVASGHLDGRRGSCHRGQIGELPGASYGDTQFVQMALWPKIGHLFGSLFRPGIADQKATGGFRRTRQRGQVSMLPGSSGSHHQLMKVVIWADIGDLLATALWPLEPRQSLPVSFFLVPLQTRLYRSLVCALARLRCSILLVCCGFALILSWSVSHMVLLRIVPMHLGLVERRMNASPLPQFPGNQKGGRSIPSSHG